MEAIDTVGLGNWADISDYVGTKTLEECRDHYVKFYLESPNYPLPVFHVHIHPSSSSSSSWDHDDGWTRGWMDGSYHRSSLTESHSRWRNHWMKTWSTKHGKTDTPHLVRIDLWLFVLWAHFLHFDSPVSHWTHNRHTHGHAHTSHNHTAQENASSM